MMKQEFFLDYNHTVPVIIEVEGEGTPEPELKISCDVSKFLNEEGRPKTPQNEQFLLTLIKHLQIQSGNETISGQKLFDAFDVSKNGRVTLSMPAEVYPGAVRLRDVNISFQKQTGHEVKSVPLCCWNLSDQEPGQAAPYENYPLTVTEMRQLANQDKTGARGIPYAGREAMRYYESPNAPLRPKTDLHSHLSAQIKPKDLIEIAVTKDKEAGETIINDHGSSRYNPKAIYYPLDLLKKMGIDEAELSDVDICGEVPPVKFSPIGSLAENFEIQARYDSAGGLENPIRAVRLSALDNDKHRHILQRIQEKITIPAAEIVDFGYVEMEIYRYANFLTKNLNLVEPMILKVAEDYAAQGVSYTEQAVTDATNPAWLEKALPAIEKAKALHGVDMRILAGIPRGLPPTVMMERIEQVKALADCPYIAGVDFLGYEMNKTKNFDWALNRLAEWAQEKRQGNGKADFVIRVHAGENGKNQDNVLDAMKAAQKYQVPIRIGHGVHFGQEKDGALPAEFTELAKELGPQGLLAVEFNMDSNIALHNIDTLNRDVPWKKWQECGVPFVLSSDGAGIYQTDVTQITAAALASGMGEKQLEQVRDFEESYIARQDGLFAKKQAEAQEKGLSVENYHSKYGKKVSKDPQAWADLIAGKEELKDRTPILLAGAGGSSWESMSPEARIEAIVLIEMLARVVEPEKAYFISGRSKDSGIAHALDLTYKHMQEEGNEHVPAFKAMLSNAGTPSLPKHITHFEWVDADFSQLAGEMIKKVDEKNGYGVFIHGSDFTRSFIMHADQREMGFALMTGVGGASERKAGVIMGDEQRERLGLPKRGVVVQSEPTKMIERMMHAPQLQGVFKSAFDKNPAALAELENEVRSKVELRNQDQFRFQSADDVMEWLKRIVQQPGPIEMSKEEVEAIKQHLGPGTHTPKLSSEELAATRRSHGPDAATSVVEGADLIGMLQQAMSGKISL